jgi:undecaprenyl-diphosphatase
LDLYAHDPFLVLNAVLARLAPDAVWLGLSFLGTAWAAFPLGLLLIAVVRRRAALRPALAFGGGMALTGALNEALKAVARTPRPLAYYGGALQHGIHVVGEPLYRFAFPSGHTATAFFASTFLVLLLGRRFAPTFVLAAAIGLSRIAVGAHFAIDVLTGAALGALTGWLTERALLRIEKRPTAEP